MFFFPFQHPELPDLFLQWTDLKVSKNAHGSLSLSNVIGHGHLIYWVALSSEGDRMTQLSVSGLPLSNVVKNVEHLCEGGNSIIYTAEYQGQKVIAKVRACIVGYGGEKRAEGPIM